MRTTESVQITNETAWTVVSLARKSGNPTVRHEINPKPNSFFFFFLNKVNFKGSKYSFIMFLLQLHV